MDLDREPEMPAFTDEAESLSPRSNDLPPFPRPERKPWPKSKHAAFDRDGKRERVYRLTRCLPEAIRSDCRLTNAARAVAAVLYYLACQSGSPAVDPSLRELINRSYFSRRAVHDGLHQLREFGYLEIEERKRPDSPVNDTNLYVLCGALKPAGPSQGRTVRRAPAAAKADRGGAKKGVVRKTPSGGITHTSTIEPSPPSSKGCRNRRFASGVGQSRRGSTDRVSPRPVPIPRLNGADPSEVSLAKRAILSLSQTCSHVTATSEDLDDFDGIIAFVERLRTEKISRFSESWWPHCVRRHRFKAYLAVVEVLLMAEVKDIGSLSGYLGGILRKPSGEGEDCAHPDITLQRTLESRGEWLDSRRPQ